MDFSHMKSVPGFPGQNSPFVSTKGNTTDYVYGSGGFDNANRVTHPTEKVLVGTHTFVIDSRQRDCSIYPSPSRYRIPIGDVMKNVTSIELRGAIIPKTSYNVHSSNQCIDFSIGDTVTSIRITNGGYGYTSAPDVVISDPEGGGVTATATATINAAGVVDSITINVAGSGYRRSTPPHISIAPPPLPNVPSGCLPRSRDSFATAIAEVGVLYKATLRIGNYTIGGNNEPGVTVIPSGLILEIQNAMNHAVNGGAYDPASVSPFAVRLVSQYPEIDAVAGTPEAFDTNATRFNRIQIVNVNSDHWELLWCTGPSHDQSSRRVMGFPWQDQSEPIATAAVNPGPGDIIPAGTSIRGNFDFDLCDFPNYTILSFWAVSDEDLERIQSIPGYGLNRKFATIVFDANGPDNLYDLDGTTSTVGGVEYLEGPVTRGTFYDKPSATKPIKGFDFDKKFLEFNPAIGKLSYLGIQFTKFGRKAGGIPEMYDFQGRDHLLIFEVRSNEGKAGNRWS